MANGKKKAKKAKKAKSGKDEAAKCELPLVCAYLEMVAPQPGPVPTPAPWFVGVQTCLNDLALAVSRLERNIHFAPDTTETGAAYSVFYSPGGGGKTPPPPPPTYP